MEYLTTAQVEAEFNLAPGSAKKAAQLGKVPAIKPGHDWLIKRSDAEAKWGHRIWGRLPKKGKTPKNEGDAKLPLDKSR